MRWSPRRGLPPRRSLPDMSAEDELTFHLELPLLGDAEAAEFAKFWDDCESDFRNMQVINWWLHCDQRDGREPPA